MSNLNIHPRRTSDWPGSGVSKLELDIDPRPKCTESEIDLQFVEAYNPSDLHRILEILKPLNLTRC